MLLHRRGQIWRIDPDSMVDRRIGEEIMAKEGRPVVVISSNSLLHQNVRIVVPFTSWQDKFEHLSFHYRVNADATNNLRNDSSANLLQVRCISTMRFGDYIGQLSDDQLEDIVAVLGLVVEGNFT